MADAKLGRAQARPDLEAVLALDGVAPEARKFVGWDTDLTPANFDPKAVSVSLLDQGSDAPPTAAVAYRGMLYVQTGGEGVADQVLICVKDAADAYSWVDLLTTPAA